MLEPATLLGILVFASLVRVLTASGPLLGAFLLSATWAIRLSLSGKQALSRIAEL